MKNLQQQIPNVGTSAPHLRELLSSAGALNSVDNHPGTNSPSGCGQNSNYTVVWSLKNW